MFLILENEWRTVIAKKDQLGVGGCELPSFSDVGIDWMPISHAVQLFQLRKVIGNVNELIDYLQNDYMGDSITGCFGSYGSKQDFINFLEKG